MKNSRELPDGTVINLDLIASIRKNDTLDCFGRNREFQVLYEIAGHTYYENFRNRKERDERFNYLKYL